MKKDDFITISELADLLGISRQSVLKQLQGKINSHEIEARTEGKTYLLNYETLPQEIKDRIEKAKKEAVDKAKNITNDSYHDIKHIEKQLWEAADKLRGNIDSSDYKHVVLGLLFLKYISDSFYQRREKLVKDMADKKSDYYIPNESVREQELENKDLYTREQTFYIPERARWDYLGSKAALPDIAKYIDNAMEAIENDNPRQLLGVLPKDYVRMPLEPHVLGELVNIFSKIDFGLDEKKEKDILGRVYEYFLGEFASSEGKRGGEFYTPRPLVKLLVEILEPFENSRVLDPAAGSGGMFV